MDDNVTSLNIIKRLPPDELLRFAKALFKAEVFTSTHIALKFPEMTPAEQSDKAKEVFIPLALNKIEDLGINSENVTDIGCFYEYMDKREEKPTKDDFPVFLSMNIMHREDWAKAIKMHVGFRKSQEKVDRRKAVRSLKFSKKAPKGPRRL